MPLTDMFMRVISAGELVCLLLSCVSYVYTYANGPSYSMKLDFSKPLNKANCTVNIGWYSSITMWAFALVCICMFFYEILLVIRPLKYGFMTNAFNRLVFYWFNAFSVLGVAAGLGLAAGIIGIIVNVCLTAVWLAYKMKCLVVADKDAPASKTGTESAKSTTTAPINEA